MAPCGACRDTGRSTTSAGYRDDLRRREARLAVHRGGREENRGVRETVRDGGTVRGADLHEEETGGIAREVGSGRSISLAYGIVPDFECELRRAG
jgi:hypothetical protein